MQTPLSEATQPEDQRVREADVPRHDQLGRLYLAFTSPKECFADIARRPTWLLCLVLLAALWAGVAAVVTPHVDIEQTIREQTEALGIELSEEQLDEQLAQAEEGAPIRLALVAAGVPIGFVILSAVFLLLLKLVGSDADYRRVLSATLHAYWPAALVSSAFTAILVQRVDSVPQSALGRMVKSHLGAFLSPESPAWLTQVASSLDVFNLWIVILLVLGMETVGSVSRSKALVVTLVPWGLYIAGKGVLFALLGG